ncbi:hypothetical protein GTZ85_36380 [Streptomyces sp. SID5474]|nr:hypothetical protein [Embleya scabrispora]MYS85543.1 hypothetical protein [Streptomyces sp. SID5474]
MEAELMTLAASGATTMVGLMVSESWAQARARIAALFGRGDPAQGSAVERELESSQRELSVAREAGDDLVIADVEAEWRTRLRRLLRADPVAAAELRALLDELAPLVPDQAAGAVHNTISGGTQHGPVVQGRDFTGLTFGSPGTAPPPPADPASGGPESRR